MERGEREREESKKGVGGREEWRECGGGGRGSKV